MKNIKIKPTQQHRLNGLVAGVLMTCLSATASAAGADFQYSGDTGPGFWDELAGAEACGRSIEPGARQTPINIVGTVRDSSLETLDLESYPVTVDLINNGHTVEQEYEGSGTSLYYDGVEYELLQFHFHTLSEHAVRGERSAMEMHAVFRDGTQTKLAVIGQFFEIGDHNDFLQTLIDAGLPEKKGDSSHSGDSINLTDGLENTSRYYTYLGSLTTPPCSEIVNWVVLREEAEMSEAQFKTFNDIMGNNYRPLQARNNRVVRRTSNND